MIGVGIRRKDGSHDDRWPERHGTGGWFEDRVVGCVEQRDGQRAQFEQRVFVRLGIARADVEAQLQEGHASSLVRFSRCRHALVASGRSGVLPERGKADTRSGKNTWIDRLRGGA